VILYAQAQAPGAIAPPPVAPVRPVTIPTSASRSLIPVSRSINAQEEAITDAKVAGSYLFYRKRKRGENPATLYLRTASGGPERMLLDLPKLSTATSHVSLDRFRLQ
jgi:hypothetical protein